MDDSTKQNETRDNDEDDNTADNTFATPYYLENFRLIIDNILNDPFSNYLMNEDDMKTVHTFQALDGLYIHINHLLTHKLYFDQYVSITIVFILCTFIIV